MKIINVTTGLLPIPPHQSKKDIVIISCWPSTEYREKLLIRVINQLKLLNKEILITSHYLVPDYITKLVDYFIYDKTNPIFSNRTLDNSVCDYWFQADSFRIEAQHIAHAAAISRSLNTALAFCKNLDYDYFTFLESDSEYDDTDLKKILDIKNSISGSGKKLFFFKLRPYEFSYWEDNGIFEVYETSVFGGFIDEFNSKLIFPKTIDEWNSHIAKDSKNYMFEYTVTESFKPYKENYLILDSTRHELTKSAMNKCTIQGFNGLYCNPSDETALILFLYNDAVHAFDNNDGNSIQNELTYEIHTIDSNKSINTDVITLNCNAWWFKVISIKNETSEIHVKIYDKDKLVNSAIYVVNAEYFNIQKNRRRIIFNYHQ